MNRSYTDQDGFIRVMFSDPDRSERVFGWQFIPFPRGESAAFGGTYRDCTPTYGAAASRQEAMRIATQRGETAATGRVVRAVRTFCTSWQPMQ